MAHSHPISALNFLLLNQIHRPIALASRCDQMDPRLGQFFLLSLRINYLDTLLCDHITAFMRL